MTRLRNFSPWAYWQLHLASQTVSKASLSRSQLRDMLGPMPQRVPLDLEVTESIDCGLYQRDRIVFDVETTMSVPAYLLVPHDAVGPRGAVLAVHGHGAVKSLVCGIDTTDSALRDDYAHQLACAGFIVLAPDLRCFGERQDPQWDPDDHKYDCDWNLVCAVLAGVNPVAQNLWDLQCCLDVLVNDSRVDSSRLGVAGLSYGGTMSLLLAALDERVSAAVVSGFVSSWRAAHRVPWNMCGSQVMWNQLGQFEHVDIARLIAPRSLLIETGTDDPIFPLSAALETVAQLRDDYSALNVDDNLVHDVFEGGHQWNGVAALDFLRKHLSLGA